MYALLDSVSPGYTQSFGEALVQKLASLPVHDGEDTSEMPDKAADKKLSSWQQLYNFLLFLLWVWQSKDDVEV